MGDLEPKAPLEILDPANGDPTYWLRFQRGVMEATEPVLAERRRARLTMEGVVFSWGRLILPAAVAAAAVASLLIPNEPPAAPPIEAVAGVEDVLESPAYGGNAGGNALPSFLHSKEDVDRDLVLLAVEIR